MARKEPDVDRAVVPLQPDVHRALQLRAAATGRSLSDLVDESLRQWLVDDLADLLAFDERRHESEIPFEQFVAVLERRGEI